MNQRVWVLSLLIGLSIIILIPLALAEDNCADGLDDDGDTFIDCDDMQCNGVPGPGGRICCSTNQECEEGESCLGYQCSPSVIHNCPGQCCIFYDDFSHGNEDLWHNTYTRGSDATYI